MPPPPGPPTCGAECHPDDGWAQVWSPSSWGGSAGPRALVGFGQPAGAARPGGWVVAGESGNAIPAQAGAGIGLSPLHSR